MLKNTPRGFERTFVAILSARISADLHSDLRRKIVPVQRGLDQLRFLTYGSSEFGTGSGEKEFGEK